MYKYKLIIIIIFIILLSCGEKSEIPKNSADERTTVRQSNVKDEVSDKDIIKIAISSPDHTTLVKALKAADLVDALSNPGPFTVFAPTNSAFDKLPLGTLEDLLKPENKNKLRDILQHHLSVAVYTADMLKDGQVLSMVDGNNVTISVKDKYIYVGKARILNSIRASNDIIHVIDDVVLP